MKNMKKVLALATAVTMCGGMIMGCGSDSTASSTDSSSGDTKSEASADDTSATTESSGEKQTITVTYRPVTTVAEDSYAKMINQAYDNWDKKDQVELVLNKVEVADSDYLTKIQLNMQDASQCGDIVYEDTFQLTSDVAAGYIADISSYLDSYYAWNDGTFLEATKAATIGSDGKYYGLPACTDSRGLVVNTNVLEAAGLGADWQPKDWAELLDGCRQIKEKCDGVIPIWFPVGKANGEGASMNGYEQFLYGTAAGNDCLYDSESGKWVVSSDGILAANEFYATVFSEGLSGDFSEVLDTGTDGYACDYLRQDKLGIYVTGSWFPSNFKEGGNYEWAEYGDVLKFIDMPTQDGSGTITMSGGWCWCIPEKSQNKDLAFEFLQEMMKPANYNVYISAESNLPTIDMSDFPELSEKPFFAEAEKKLESALFRPKNEDYTTVSTYIAQMGEEAATGGDAQAAMDSFKSNVASAIGEEKTITK